MPLGKAQPCGQEKHRAAAAPSGWCRASGRVGPERCGAGEAAAAAAGPERCAPWRAGPPRPCRPRGPTPCATCRTRWPAPAARRPWEETARPAPDLLMARSFGDKVGCSCLGTPGAERGRMVDLGPPLPPGRAHPSAPFPGIRHALAPRSLGQSVSSCCPRGVAAAG